MRVKFSTLMGGFAVAACLAATFVAMQTRAGDRNRDDASRYAARDGATAGRCVSTPLKGSRVIDDRTIMVDDWHGNAAVLTLTGPCLDKHTWGVRIKLIGLQDEICRADDVDTIADTSPGAPGVCAVRSVELLSRAEAEGRAPRQGAW